MKNNTDTPLFTEIDEPKPYDQDALEGNVKKVYLDPEDKDALKSISHPKGLYTPMAHEKIINGKRVYRMQLIKGDHHGGGKPLPHRPTDPGNSRYIPHVGKKQLAKKSKNP